MAQEDHKCYWMVFASKPNSLSNSREWQPKSSLYESEDLAKNVLDNLVNEALEKYGRDADILFKLVKFTPSIVQLTSVVTFNRQRIDTRKNY